MEYKRQPWEHQRVAIEDRVISNKMNDFGLFFEVGTGKSATAINIIRHWYEEHGRVLPTLIVSPPITLENWGNEWAINSDVDPKKVVILYGSEKERIKKFQARSSDDIIVITNYEALYMANLVKELMSWKPLVVVGDELHKIKDHTSRRAKILFPFADNAYYRLGLTGTPILNSYMDIFSQFRFLDKGETFGRNFFTFRSKYFFDRNAGMPRGSYFPNWQPRPNIAKELESLISKKSMTVKADDCLSLPPILTQNLVAGMTKEQSKAYTQMAKDLVAYITDTKVAEAQLALTKALRLQQIVSGFVKLDDGTIHRFEDCPREKQLEGLLEEHASTNKILVWAVFKENYAAIKRVCEKLKLGYAEVTGDISDKDAEVERFKSDPNCRVFIGHPLSAGIGINLIEARITVFYSRDFSLEQYIQARGRNRRGGSEIHKSILQYNLVTEGTIDIQVMEALENKQAISDSVIHRALLGKKESIC